MLNTPVLFLIFNRPDTTKIVFEAIRQAKPKQLFIAADGPREGRPDDARRCELVRQIASQIDWSCEVKTLFRDSNLGCKLAVSSAIDWFFSHVEEGIILEDDCLPNKSFFPYCTELLKAYRANDQVMHISGTNFQFGQKRGNASYYFSNYFHVWGWATWRRAWRLYDVNLIELDTFLAKNKIVNILKLKSEQQYWTKVFNDVKRGEVNTWDYQWLFSIWANNGICITPNVNLISNLGFGADATHTVELDTRLANLKIEEMREIIHPGKISINHLADRFTFQKAIHVKSGFNAQIKNQLGKLVPHSIKEVMKKML